MIDVHGLTKSYENKKVVNQVSLLIKKGTFTACIGPNGAGKSTLLEMLGRLVPYDEGHIYFEGDELRTVTRSTLATRLSVLKQSSQLSVGLTVRELVSFGRFPYTKGKLTPHCQAVINRSLAYLNMTDMQDRRLDTLSGGQFQRAMIAMVLSQDTDYILLDEPLNNLDMHHGVQMMQTLQNLVQDLGKTVVLVVHDINFAASYADRIIAMKDGYLFASGTTNEVITESVLSELYEMDLDIIEKDGVKYCFHYK
ncbi:Iron compound ABC uptake transporter ATP-binding protein [Alkalibacterium sp. AK22]|uniref:iron ABC transporter ATP-binding protein n=1 Tax=Alkalibacterium sp. AK22 TaxID=1229520 RepID=UPI000445FD31|nr:ATP-binding cassette domain-containing protein [Alkalibacterium sp. AK22]EXJ22838.1 Iron compound ABC uptake transporter ATP-binding protein [Alkalibacterium sp. AK22]